MRILTMMGDAPNYQTINFSLLFILYHIPGSFKQKIKQKHLFFTLLLHHFRLGKIAAWRAERSTVSPGSMQMVLYHNVLSFTITIFSFFGAGATTWGRPYSGTGGTRLGGRMGSGVWKKGVWGRQLSACNWRVWGGQCRFL